VVFRQHASSVEMLRLLTGVVLAARASAWASQLHEHSSWEALQPEKWLGAVDEDVLLVLGLVVCHSGNGSTEGKLCCKLWQLCTCAVQLASSI
jgi:hypothetical protein